MLKRAGCIAFVFLAIAPIDGQAGVADDEYFRDKMVENLRVASIWLIEEGVYTFQQKGKEGIHRKLIDDWAVQIWVDPWIESERYIDGFWIKARGIHHDVINFHREYHSSFLYEFWIVKVNGSDWSGVDNRATFYIAKTNDIYGKREILESSEQFIEQYSIGENTTIYFPTNDPEILYELKAWLYLENFKESDLKNIRAEMSRDGTIKLVRTTEQ